MGIDGNAALWKQQRADLAFSASLNVVTETCWYCFHHEQPGTRDTDKCWCDALKKNIDNCYMGRPEWCGGSFVLDNVYMEQDFVCKLSISNRGDSVVQIGDVPDLETTYYGHYTKAFKAIEEKVENELVLPTTRP